MDSGEEAIADKALAADLRTKSAGIHRRALGVAGAITLVVLLFPDLSD